MLLPPIPPEGASSLGPGTYFWLLLVPLLPLAAWVVQTFLGNRLPRKGDWLPTGAMGVAAVIAIWQLIRVFAQWDPDFLMSSTADGYSWKFFFSSEQFTGGLAGFHAGILYDNLSAILLAMVALVSFLVHLFSIGYMQGDSRYSLFFSNLSLFTFAMLAMVLSDNLFFFFIFWEIMGLCSYLLIGHLATDKTQPRMSAAWASLKAFMTTRVGDVALFVGMAMVFTRFGTLSFHGLYQGVSAQVAAHGWDSGLTTAGLFMFMGAVGKSAQFPLHIWLPDAMEGPTPVSAMIHAATMVAAGVYLTGRIFLVLSPTAQLVVACVGAFTAIFAATIGMTAFDIKKVLAYSTISQLGYMICSIGVGGMAAGLFHVIIHALFKACLFLGSGSVILGCHHEQDMRKMGGLRKRMPVTYFTMLASTLAISGIPLFAGFYSKDAIIARSLEKSMQTGQFIWALPFLLLVVAAAVTAFYMFRLIFMTFHGEPRAHGAEHAKESPRTMTIPLIVLGLGAVLGGKFWLADPLHALGGGSEPWFLQLVRNPKLADWNPAAISEAGGYGANGAVLEAPEGSLAAETEAREEERAHEAHGRAMIFSVLAAGLGTLLAFLFYLWKVLSPAEAARRLGGVYRLVYNKYWIDELNRATIVRGTFGLSRLQGLFDKVVIDGLVNFIGRFMRRLANGVGLFDAGVVDGAVNGVAGAASSAGQMARRMQTGRIQQYTYFTLAGALVLSAVVLLGLF